ncbi:MAG TPA: OmpA family protein [Candidatus Enterococcus avicola]|uniref:OmpA family protein n=1 Tax=Candidatus Enterococcus avicola TaxID=2838561 RepID=A0A9D2JI29_9ENTE|nr:OmpA family protein [Candidatus Enterococcus avicola]
MKRKKRPEQHIDESWLLPYADMLTLVLALFIVMFAMAKVDEGKFEEFRDQFGVIFSGTGSGGDSIIGSVIDFGEHSGAVPQDEDELEETTMEKEVAKENKLAQKMEDQQMVEVSEKLKEELKALGLSGDTNVSLRSDGLHINLDSNILFQPGEAQINAQAKKSLDSLSSHLKNMNQEVVVAGHTDTIAINPPYKSNWELSAARAISVMDYLIAQKVINRNRISIQAYGDTKPHATNQTEKGRAKNRRVEITIKKVYQ